MPTNNQLSAWLDEHRESAFALLRVFLGLALVVRGVLFIVDDSAYIALLDAPASSAFASAALMHYVALSHLAGGALLTIGLVTRIAALVQVPILAGAVFVVHLGDGLGAASQSLELAALVLVLLVVYTIAGGGAWSVDAYLARPAEPEEAVPAGVDTRPDRDRLLRRSRKAPAGAWSVPVRYDRSPIASTCACGHDVDHPSVKAEGVYGFRGAFYTLAGITAPPREIVFRCTDCGTVLQRSRSREVIERYRYDM